ncbi:hypothetical protein ACE1OC_39560 [Streptomyces sp. DSM 116496]|uniref:hypothetical protein n=1 Tax=Streptomyces stoeckheimensis TaxID=3344656 RepID=UPI0038B2A6CD
MAVLSTILVILGAWCAASVATVALYAALRRLHVRRQRAAAAVPDAVRTVRGSVPGARTGRPGRPVRPGRAHRHHRLPRLHRHHGPAHPSGRSGRGRRVPPPDLQAG